MESLLKDMNLEQLEQVKAKYPQYLEVVEKEITRRKELEKEVETKLQAEMEKLEAEKILEDKYLKAVEKLFPNGLPFTNLLLTYVEKEIDNGEPVEIMVNGKKEVRTPKVVKKVFEIHKNVTWKREGEKFQSGNTTSKGAREVTITKVVNGNVVERSGFSNGELASEHFGIPKDKQSANTRLANYKGHANTRYLVDYGIAEGVKLIK